MSKSIDILRFATAGSVDDGKSTLIGRLLFDTKGVFTDQLEALEGTSHSNEEKGIDLALITDGLRAEREQGITIDVAYRYFSTTNRKFIIADTPVFADLTIFLLFSIALNFAYDKCCLCPSLTSHQPSFVIIANNFEPDLVYSVTYSP